ncbi:hypothetical protein [Streptomyces sp. NPDC051561]|uniref:hypothetical protein n=1 Tax=Streptomyces sp. NPDC051561 TaxID=3365658 RepID=UPI0037BCD319
MNSAPRHPAPPAKSSSSRPLPRILLTAALPALPLLAILGGEELRTALDFTSGVLALISLTAAVAWGLLATDRLLLRPRHRLIAQAVHRTTSVASLSFLLLHLTVKVALGHVSLLAALLPFAGGLSGTATLIGLGSLAGLLMVVAATTGALRSAFASPGGVPGRWRTLHMLAYPAWCAGLLHGLFTGRPADGWVVAMYALCLAAVTGALCLRLLPARLKRHIVAGSLPPAPSARPTGRPSAGVPPFLPVPQQRLPLDARPYAAPSPSAPRHAHTRTGDRR